MHVSYHNTFLQILFFAMAIFWEIIHVATSCCNLTRNTPHVKELLKLTWKLPCHLLWLKL